MKLSPPIPIVTNLVKKILSITGYKLPDKKLHKSTAGSPLNYLILKNEILKKTRENQDSDIVKIKSEKLVQLDQLFQDKQVQNEKLINGQRQQFIDSKHSKGLLIHRIPFTHVNQIGDILKILRQQVIFNELYLSCFNPEESLSFIDSTTVDTFSLVFDKPCRKRKRDDDEDNIAMDIDIHKTSNDLVAEVKCFPPHTFCVVFLDPRMNELVSITINISLNGSLSVSMVGQSNQDLNTMGFTKTLEDSHNLSFTLQHYFSC